jgi:hypothetical protein
MWYSQQDWPSVPAEQRSLVVAFANLLKKINKNVDPANLYQELVKDDPVIDMHSIERVFGVLEIEEISNDATWPANPLAVIRFRRMDEAAAGPLDHFCVNADMTIRSMIDSYDGKIKGGSGIYGHPTGWISFKETDPDPVEDPAGEPIVREGDDPRLYTVLKGGESVWQIAMKLNMSAMDLIDHNELDTPSLLPEGTVLHLPYARPASDTKHIVYEYFSEKDPLLMHIAKPGGARKYAFANVKRWTDLTQTGPTYAEGTPLKIYAIARVPVPEDGSEAAFFMDRIAVGANGERVAYTIGFNHSHLADGHPQPKPTPAPAVQATLEEIKETVEQVEKASVAVVQPAEPAELSEKADNTWRETYTPFDAPIEYLFKRDTMVHDLATERRSKLKYRLDPVTIAGTFYKDEVLYGRPLGAIKQRFWFGVPMKNLLLESELHALPTHAEQIAVKQATGDRLSYSEQYVIVPISWALGRFTWLDTRIKDRLATNKQKTGVK